MRHSLRIILVVFSFSSFVGFASEQTRIEALHNEVYQLLDTDLDAAMTLSNSCVLLAQREGLAWEEANGLYIKGFIFWQKNELPNALVMYLKASSILDQLRDDENAVNTYVEITLNIGVILRKYSKYKEALEIYEEGLSLATRWEIEDQRLNLLYNKAYCLRKQGKTQDALEVLKATTSLANELENHKMLLKSFNLLGLVHKDGDYHEEAREYFQYILDHPNATTKDKGRAYHNIATTYRNEGNHEKIKNYLDRALALKRSIQNNSLLFTTLFDLSEWHLDQNNLSDAESYALEAESLYATLFKGPNTFDIFYLLGNIFEAKGDLKEAKSYSDQAYQESKTLLEEQQTIITELRQFQMDLIISGFESEKMANEEQQSATLYRWLAMLGGVLVVLVLITWKLWFAWWRRSLWKGLEEVM